MPRWLQTCIDQIHRSGLDPHLVEVLAAFPSPVDPNEDETGPFDALGERDLDLDIPAALIGEVDGAQAQMFARRYQSVQALPGGPAWQILRVGFARRMAAILASPGPRARRVRALIDYAFAHAAVLRWADPDLPQPGDLRPEWRDIAAGVSHARTAGMSHARTAGVSHARTAGRSHARARES